MARAVAPAETDAQTANVAERTAERASAVREVAAAKQRQFVGELEAEHARALQAAEQTAEATRIDLSDAYDEVKPRPGRGATAGTTRTPRRAANLWPDFWSGPRPATTMRSGLVRAEAKTGQRPGCRKAAAVTEARDAAENTAS